MININRIIKVSNGQTPYRVIVNTSGTSRITERSNNTYEVNLIYDTEDQIGTGDTITVIDDLGCIRSIPLQITNVCESLFVSDIQRTQGFGNDVQTTLGGQSFYSITSNQTVTVDWSIDDPQYYTLEAHGQSVSLTQVDSGIQQTNLRATVTNQNGCTEERRFSLFPCRTLAQPSTILLRLNVETGLYEANRVPMRGSTSCQGATINWSTAIITNNTQLTVIQRPGQPYVDVTSATPIDTQTVYFSVANSQGLRSNTSRLVFTSSEELANGFSNPPGLLVIPSDENNIILSTSDFGITNATGINPTLTTALTATFNNGIVSASVTGQPSATIGLNTTTGPSVISIIRELPEFQLASQEIAVYCSSNTINLKSISGVDKVNRIVSGQGLLNNDILTVSQNNQAVIVNVTNINSQSTDLTIYACGDCGTNVIISSCEPTITPFNLLTGNPRPNGTWTSVGNTQSVPTTYNGTVNIIGLGLNAWVYSAPSFVGDYECSTATTYVLELTTTTPGNVSNNNCTTPTDLQSISAPGSKTVQSNISSNCAIKTTWSNKPGNKKTHLYDQWFEVEVGNIDAVPANSSTLLTVTLTGTGATPISLADIQLWNDCNTTTPNVTYNQTLNMATATVTIPANSTTNKYIQVLSDTTGSYLITINQEVV